MARSGVGATAAWAAINGIISAMTTPPLPEPVAAGLAPRPVRRWRRRLFQVYLLAAMVGFAILFVLATNLPYLPVDLTITHAVQSYHARWFLSLMQWISWPGFSPQTSVITGALCLLVFATGLRWEAVCAAVAGVGGAGLGTVIKFIVQRPRPGADLVSVVEQLNSYSFPSGHVLFYTAFFGFLFYLTYTLFKRAAWRALVLALLGLLVALVGVSRIELGQHWFSDVLAAYLLGSVWLALSVQVYQWGKGRFFVRHAAQSTPP